MKIDLDELERNNTTAAIALATEWVRDLVVANNSHMLPDLVGALIVNSPPVTLSLIARTRTLEAFIAAIIDPDPAVGLSGLAPETVAAIRALIDEGAVIE